MSLPKVVITGRPNVGKSSLFNWLAGRRLAIVDSVAGVTRDRMNHLIHHGDRYFEIVDTGGIGINDVDDLDEEIAAQIEAGLREADLLMFVTDALDGLVPADEQIARRLRSTHKPLLLVANKCDGDNWEQSAQADFGRLGLGSPCVVSARNNRRRELLLDAIVDALPPAETATERELAPPVMKIAIVGRRNTGKSTFVNTLAGQPRMIVSEVAGTTRDSVDVRFEMDGHAFVAIDTPGLRRGKAVRTDLDFYSDHRAHRSIRHADVTLLFFDCTSRISAVDRKLASYIEGQFKPCIFVVNKWDLLAGEMPTGRWAEYLREQFASMDYVPIAFITGQTGRNVHKLVNHAQMLFRQARQRITTGRLNRLVRQAINEHAIPASPSARPRVLYATQIGTEPPTIVLKCNDPEAIRPDWRRYLLNRLRDGLSFGEIPVRLVFETRSSASENQIGLEDRAPDDPLLADDSAALDGSADAGEGDLDGELPLWPDVGEEDDDWEPVE